MHLGREIDMFKVTGREKNLEGGLFRLCLISVIKNNYSMVTLLTNFWKTIYYEFRELIFLHMRDIPLKNFTTDKSEECIWDV